MVTDHPRQRFVEIAEVAGLVIFLASDAAPVISGIRIPVDTGGLATCCTCPSCGECRDNSCRLQGHESPEVQT